MNNLKFKHLFEKKGILICFLFVCSLLISEKTLAIYNKTCCGVHGNTSHIIPKRDHITIFFKFFQYEKKNGLQNSYIQEFEVKYSTNKGESYIHLASASTKNQTYKTWAWIEFKDKKPAEKIELYSLSRTQLYSKTTLNWNEGTNPLLEVASELSKTNEAWCGIRWLPDINLLDNVTHVQIKAIWYNHEKKKAEVVVLKYNITPVKAKLISKSLNFQIHHLNQR